MGVPEARAEPRPARDSSPRNVHAAAAASPRFIGRGESTCSGRGRLRCRASCCERGFVRVAKQRCLLAAVLVVLRWPALAPLERVCARIGSCSGADTRQGCALHLLSLLPPPYAAISSCHRATRIAATEWARWRAENLLRRNVQKRVLDPLEARFRGTDEREEGVEGLQSFNPQMWQSALNARRRPLRTSGSPATARRPSLGW